MARQREEIQIQEYVCFQEMLNTILRTLERIERLERIPRSYPVTRNGEADYIHKDYDTARQALTTQCICLQVSLLSPKFKANALKNDLKARINDWAKGSIQNNSRISEALILVFGAIEGTLNLHGHSSIALPSDQRAVESILRTNDNLNNTHGRALCDPASYIAEQKYPLEMSHRFLSQNEISRINNLQAYKNQVTIYYNELLNRIESLLQFLDTVKDPNGSKLKKTLQEEKNNIPNYINQALEKR